MKNIPYITHQYFTRIRSVNFTSELTCSIWDLGHSWFKDSGPKGPVFTHKRLYLCAALKLFHGFAHWFSPSKIPDFLSIERKHILSTIGICSPSISYCHTKQWYTGRSSGADISGSMHFVQQCWGDLQRRILWEFKMNILTLRLNKMSKLNKKNTTGIWTHLIISL